MRNIKIKVCGITDKKNYNDLKKYPISYFGFIFYDKSPRYILNKKNISFIKNIPNKVGVFVDEDHEKVLSIANKYDFSIIQLHGNESENYCKILRSKGLCIIKSQLIRKKTDFKETKSKNIDFNLFDYKSKDFGGSGKSFNWNILNTISLKKKYFLSGGVSMNNLNDLNKIKDKNYLYGLDLNSKFEKYPGYKDIKLIDKFFNIIR